MQYNGLENFLFFSQSLRCFLFVAHFFVGMVVLFQGGKNAKNFIYAQFEKNKSSNVYTMRSNIHKKFILSAQRKQFFY